MLSHLWTRRLCTVWVLAIAWVVLFGVDLRAEIRFRAEKKEIVFTDQEVALLEPILRASAEPTSEQVRELVGRVPANLQRKLEDLILQTFLMDTNQDAQAFMRENQLEASELAKIREWYFDSAAQSVLEALVTDPRCVVRLLGRDMGEVYFRLESLLLSPNLTLEFPAEAKAELLRRVKLVTVSRSVAGFLDSWLDFQEAFGVSDAELAQASVVHLLDVGYEGNLPRSTREILRSSGKAEKFQWSFFFRAPNAPRYVDSWKLSQFEQKLRTEHPNLLKEGILHRLTDSFRVRLIEHQARWNKRSEGIIEGPVWIMLDLDDTVLKEVPIDYYAGHEAVQEITYTPELKAYEKYAQRLKEGPSRDKVIHYKLLKNSGIKSTVAVRPGLEELFRDLEPLLKSGHVKIAITSANDPKRTRAVLDQLVVAGKKLKDWGAIDVPQESFAVKGGKSIARLRKSLEIPRGSAIVAVDDLPEKIIDFTENDSVIGVGAWDQKRVSDFLEDIADSRIFALSDLAFFRRLGRLIRDMRYQREPSIWKDRLLVLAQLAGFQKTTDWEQKLTSHGATTRHRALSVTPRENTGLFPKWKKWKQGLVEVGAMLAELYPDREIYGLERDGVWFLYAAELAAQGDPAILNRLHYLDFSTRAETENAKSFLAQEGISTQALREGKKFLFVDGGYLGTIPRRIREFFPERYESQLQSSFMISGNAYSPSTRSFMLTLGRDSLRGNPKDYLSDIQEFEEKLPKEHPKSCGFEKQGERWIPIYFSNNSDVFDGELSPDKHQKYLEDLAAYFAQPKVLEHLMKRRLFWRELRQRADRNDTPRVIALLRHTLEEAGEDPWTEAVVRDFIERYPTFVSEYDVGLKPAETPANTKENLDGFAMRFPEWAPILKNPKAKLARLVAEKKFRTIELLSYAIVDAQFRISLFNALQDEELTPQIEAALRGQMLPNRETDEEVLDFLVEKYFRDLSKPVESWLMNEILTTLPSDMVEKRRKSLESVLEKSVRRGQINSQLFQRALGIRNRSKRVQFLKKASSSTLEKPDCKSLLQHTTALYRRKGLSGYGTVHANGVCTNGGEPLEMVFNR